MCLFLDAYLHLSQKLTSGRQKHADTTVPRTFFLEVRAVSVTWCFRNQIGEDKLNWIGCCSWTITIQSFTSVAVIHPEGPSCTSSVMSSFWILSSFFSTLSLNRPHCIVNTNIDSYPFNRSTLDNEPGISLTDITLQLSIRLSVLETNFSTVSPLCCAICLNEYLSLKLDVSPFGIK